MHHGADNVERGVGEAQHEEQRKLVLDGQEEEVVDVGRVEEALDDHRDPVEEARRGGPGVVLHDGLVYGMLQCQEAFPVVA